MLVIATRQNGKPVGERVLYYNYNEAHNLISQYHVQDLTILHRKFKFIKFNLNCSYFLKKWFSMQVSVIHARRMLRK